VRPGARPHATPDHASCIDTRHAQGGRSIRGDVIRVVLVDDHQTTASFDIPLNSELSGGFVTDMWGHIILSVTETVGPAVAWQTVTNVQACQEWSTVMHVTAPWQGIGAYIDGQPIAWDQFGFQNDRRDPRENVAYPDPTKFHGATTLGPFTMASDNSRPRYDGPGLDYLGCFDTGSTCDYTCIGSDGAADDSKCTSPDGRDSGGTDCCASMSWGEPLTCASGYSVQVRAATACAQRWRSRARMRGSIRD
jgi:hypothetical protein